MTSKSWGVRVAVVALIASTAWGCTRSPEATKARHLERAESHRGEQRHREAILDYRNVLRLEPENPVAIRGLGLAHLALGELAQSYGFLTKAAALDPDDLEVQAKLASLYLLENRADDARAAAERILAAEPRNVEALLLLAGAARGEEAAAAALARIDEAATELGEPASLLLARGALLLRMKQPEKAGEAFRDAVENDPDSVDARNALGAYYVHAQDPERAEDQFRKAAELSAWDSKERLQLVDYYLFTGHRAEARLVLEQMNEKAPDFVPGWVRSAEIALLERRHDDARRAIAAAIEKSPDDFRPKLLRGRLVLAEGDVRAALEALNEVVQSEPRSAQGRYYLALALLESGNSGRAKSELAQATEIAPGYVDAALLLARLNAASGAHDPAIDALKAIVEKQPRHAEALKLLGEAELAKGDAAAALGSFERYREVAPDDPRGPYLAAQALRRRGLEAESDALLDAALALDPTFAEALLPRVQRDLANEDFAAAAARIEARLAEAPNSGKLHTLLGVVRLAEGDVERAETEFLTAVEKEPTILQPYVSLAGIYARSQRFDEAVAKFEAALEIRPRNTGLRTLLGTLLQIRGRLDEAEAAYRAALDVNPRLAPAANNLAYLYAEREDRRDEALALAQVAAEALPEDPRVADTLGWILHLRGVSDRALRLLAMSAKELPDDPEVQYHYGLALRESGDRSAARDALERALAIDDRFAGAEQAKAALAELR